MCRTRRLLGRQRRRDVAVQQELAHLITHGILHLMGHDHMNDEDEREMSARERRVMERVTNIDGQDG